MELDEETCPVCLKVLGDKGIFITKCGHTFCGACIFANLNYTNKCPLCRQVIIDGQDDVTDSPISTPSEAPEQLDIVCVYTDLILQNLRDDSDPNREMVRGEIMDLLQSFDLDMRLLSPPPQNRRLSVSDLDYNPAPYSSENDVDGYDSVDEIISTLNIPEN